MILVGVVLFGVQLGYQARLTWKCQVLGAKYAKSRKYMPNYLGLIIPFYKVITDSFNALSEGGMTSFSSYLKFSLCD